MTVLWAAAYLACAVLNFWVFWGYEKRTFGAVTRGDFIFCALLSLGGPASLLMTGVLVLCENRSIAEWLGKEVGGGE